MHTPTITLAAAGALGLIFTILSGLVVRHRAAGRVVLGSGEEAGRLFVAIRSHANFAEYVPVCLILIGLLELCRGSTLLVKILAGVLVLARAAHPIGMVLKAPNAFRAGGFAATIVVVLAASVAAIVTAVIGPW